MKNIRILLADDHGLLRLGLKTLISFQSGLEVVGDAQNGQVAIELALRLKPDIVVMDLMMPVLDGVEATREIRRKLPETKVLILTSYGTASDVSRAIQAGATGALMKDTPNLDLISAIRSVAAGEKVFSPEIAQTLTEDPAPPELTDRQLDVLNAAAHGYTNPEIAKLLSISTDAVKQHIITICEKLGAVNRTEAVAIALRKHLLKM